MPRLSTIAILSAVAAACGPRSAAETPAPPGRDADAVAAPVLAAELEPLELPMRVAAPEDDGGSAVAVPAAPPRLSAEALDALVARCAALGPEVEPEPPCGPVGGACSAGIAATSGPRELPAIEPRPGLAVPPEPLVTEPPAEGVVRPSIRPSAIRDVVRAQRDELACCVEAGAAPEGRAALRIVTGGGREHPEVTVQRGGASGPDVMECIAGVVRTWRFPRFCDPCSGPEAGYESTVMISYPIGFVTAGE